MKKTILAVAAAAAMSFSLSAEEKNPAELKVLMIGNSFSICNLKQMPPVAAAMGRKLDLVSLYIGGCSIERHWNNIVAGTTNATFRPYRTSWNYASLADQSKVPFAACLADRPDKNGNVQKFANIPEMLASEKWDVVTFQQASHYSWRPETYYPCGDFLVAKIRELAPQAKIVIQETWSYPPWDKRLKGFGVDQVDMYARLHNAYAGFAGKYGFDIIPVGTAAEFVPERNTLFNRPDFHFNRDGEYLQGLAFTAKLFGVDVRKCPYRPDWMEETRAAEIRAAVMDAIENRPLSRRAFRDARVTRGNTNIIRQQPIDGASWIWLPGDDGKLPINVEWGEHPAGATESSVKFAKFRKAFTVGEDDGAFVIDVSADERFYLTLDGEFVARGPNRSTVENWQYNTYVIDAKPGEHVLEAVVWAIGDHGPLAQLSYRAAFALAASGPFDERLTTGKADWEVARVGGIRPIGKDGGAWGTGEQFEIVGAGPYAVAPSDYVKAAVVRGPAGSTKVDMYGGRTGGWMLFPSQLPDQTEYRVLPGRVKAVAKGVKFREKHVYTEAEAKETVDLSKPLTIPAHTRVQFAWDLGVYTCVYPEVKLSRGRGAKVSFAFTESARRGDNHLKTSAPGSRDAIVGRYLDAFGDIYLPDGRAGAVFSSPWFRVGKWCRVDVETQGEPLVIDSVALVESRYPLEMRSSFACPDRSLADVRRICARAMQMCCHEMLFDCPYYEQQMYPGDTRVQLNVLSALSRDDRMIKRAIELYDLNARDDGQCPFNFPTRGIQEGASYTLCYLLMYGDYAMNHADREWLRARLPGLRKSMSGMEFYENGDGLLENLPGWNFMDWVTGWPWDGTTAGCRWGDGVNAELNLYWVLAMKSAATTERALGNELQAQYWEAKSEKLKKTIVEKFWCEKRGILADSPAMKDFSEHAQCLALLGDVLPADKAQSAWKHLVEDADLKRCTVYFSYYLFETYFKFGRGDLFLKRLDLWRDYVKKGLTTTQESPDKGKNFQVESRSDCHAWGAHPIWFMQTGLAGIKSDAPFFGKVLVAPCPGDLKSLKAAHPHPKGWIEVDLAFDGGKAVGTVKTPVAGRFVFGGQSVDLRAGSNAIGK